MSALAKASKDQAVSLKGVNEAVSTIDGNTQQNQFVVTETNGASHSLASEADALFELVHQFKLGEPTHKIVAEPLPATGHGTMNEPAAARKRA